MTPIAYLLFAITLNSQTGEEVERHRVEGTPVYEHVEECSAAQAATGTQRPTMVGDIPQITVYSCVALRGDQST